MQTGNDSRAKVLVLDANLKHASELSHRLKFLNYDPVIAATSGSGVDPDGVTDDYLRAGSYELVLAGEKVPARLHLGPLYDPAMKRIKC